MVLVVYILNEDSGAGFKFFNTYVCLLTGLYDANTSNGNNGLEKSFNEIKDKLQSGDKLIVLFDSVSSKEGFQSYNFMKRVKKPV